MVDRLITVQGEVAEQVRRLAIEAAEDRRETERRFRETDERFRELEQRMGETDGRLNVLINTVDSIVRGQPPPPAALG